MKYNDVLRALSGCEIGAIVIATDGEIIAYNDACAKLFHAASDLVGRKLNDVSPVLWQSVIDNKSNKNGFVNIAFGEYLRLFEDPGADDLPPGSRIVAFRDASSEAQLDLMRSIVDKLRVSVVLFDAEGRLLYMNKSAMDLDSLVMENASGKNVTALYTMENDEDLSIPQVLKSRKAYLKHLHRYKTLYGKTVDAMAYTYPVIKDNEVLGAYNILEDLTELDSLHRQILELQEKLLDKKKKNQGGSDTKSVLQARFTFEDIVWSCESMRKVLMQCRQAARTDSSIMICGETGTGKEMIAQSIHNASRRSNGPFLAINCAAIPADLLEGLLFGTEKGAYTGAISRSGLFEQANGGTLLLDELNSMPLSLQSKLLRVLQDGMIRRVGGTKEIKVDVRFFSNLNVPPLEAVSNNKLRSDLYYRLGVVNIYLPPLRERKEDIPLFVKYFIGSLNKSLDRKVSGVEDTVMNIFLEYEWPGNVRELEHAIEHAMNVMSDGETLITAEHIPSHIVSAKNTDALSASKKLNKNKTEYAPDTQVHLNNEISKLEYKRICEVLKKTNGNITRSATFLNISRQNLQYRIKKYHIDIPALVQEYNNIT